MVSVVYFISLIAACFICIQITSSMVVHDRYLPLMEIDADYDEPIYLPQRSAQFLFSPKSYPGLINPLKGYHPTKRHSFGRKHHWDAFFGRR